VNDAFSVLEDSGANSLNVLGNDLAAAGGTITLVSSPRLGTAVISGGTISYTPSANANGPDALTYRVQVGTQISNVANVSITIVPVNDAPTAVDDGPISVNTGVATALTTLLANDLDPDGATDLAQAQVASQPVAFSGQPGGATVSTGADGVITITATREDTYTFTYRAIDRSGTPSANVATVTINAIFTDTVVPSSALFRTDKTRWIVTGTDSSPNQLISVFYANGIAPNGITNAALTPVLIGTAQADALGNWTMDFLPATGILDPRNWKTVPTLIKATSPLGGSGSVGLTIRK
jgi:Bacterial Ig domain